MKKMRRYIAMLCVFAMVVTAWVPTSPVLAMAETDLSTEFSENGWEEVGHTNEPVLEAYAETVTGAAIRMKIGERPEGVEGDWPPWKPFLQGVNSTVIGDTYQASFWMKGTGKVTVRVQNSAGNHRYSEQVLTATDEWTEYKLQDTTITRTDGIAIWVFGTHISDILMDDFFLGKNESKQNLLVNPGFEEGDLRWGGAGLTWNPRFLWVEPGAGRTGEPTPTPEPTPEPNPDEIARAVKMNIPANPSWSAFAQSITGAATGEQYSGSFWIKGTGTVTVRFVGNGDKNYTNNTFPATNQWTKHNIPTATVEDGLTLMIYGSHVCNLLMDDFYVSKVGETDNRLINPGFEDGQTGWGGGAWTHPSGYLTIDSVNGRVVETLDENGFIDECTDNSFLLDYSANQAKYSIRWVGAEPKNFRGDMRRLYLRDGIGVGQDRGYVIYHTDYDIESFSTDVFYNPEIEARDILVSVSTDNVNYIPVTLDRFDDGGFWRKIIYSSYNMPIPDARYIKVAFPPVEEGYKSLDVQISRILVNLSSPYVTASGDETTGITLSTTAPNAKIFYTLGSSTEEIEYTTPIPVVGNTIINAYAKIRGKEKSFTRRFSYVSQDAIYVDKYGQVKNIDFPGKVTSDQELIDDVEADTLWYNSLTPPERDQYGGLPGSKDTYGLEAKGYFNIQKLDGKYVMVTPEGNLFFSLGSTGIGNVGETFTRFDTREHMYEWLPAKTEEGGRYQTAFRDENGFSWYVANLIKKYNKPFSEGEFYSRSVERIKKWGFTSEGAWSKNPQMGDNADNFPQYGFVYFPTAAQYYVGNADWKLFDVFRDDIPTVISNSFKQYKVDTYKDSPWIIGWFFGNESKYQQFNTAVTGANSAGSATKQAFIKMLEDKYGTIAALNASWQTEYASFDAARNASMPIKTNDSYEDMLAFLEIYLEKYYSIVQDEFRKLNPNHMLVGDRYLVAPMNNADTRRVISKVAGKYLDVLSYNYYTGNLDINRLQEIVELADTPLMFTEFHYGDPTRGLNGGIRVVNNEEEKGKGYRNYVEHAAASGLVVGTHWFTYLDQAATGRYLEGFNGEAYGIGMIDVADRPYKTMLDHVMETNYRIYDLVLGNVEPYTYSLVPEKPSDQTVEIQKAETPVSVDGIKEEAWQASQTLVMDARHQIVGLVNGSISAEVDLLWDNTNLYLYAHINDDTPGLNPYPLPDNPGRGIDWIWNGDALEIFVGPEDLDAKGQLREKDTQIIISAKGLYYWYNHNKITQPEFDVAVHVDEANQAYAIEAAIPLELLGLDHVANGRKLRFDVGFDNGDGNGRIAQYLWNGVEGNAQNRDRWGTAILIGEDEPIITPDPTPTVTPDPTPTVTPDPTPTVTPDPTPTVTPDPTPTVTPNPTPTVTPNPTPTVTPDPTPTVTPEPTPTVTPVVVKHDKKTATVSAKVDSKKGIAKVDETILDALSKQAVQKKAKVIEIAVNVPKGAKEVEVKLQRKAFEKLADSTKTDVRINAGIASVTFDGKAIDSIRSSAAGGDITVSIQAVDKSTLTASARATVGKKLIYDFTLTSGNKIISEFGKGKAVISIPYTLKPGEKTNSVVVYYMDSSGKLVKIKGKYDKATKTVTILHTIYSYSKK